MLSIIIVNYKVKDLLYKCIESIYKTAKNLSFEIIVVDNDERKIESDLYRKFPKVKYLSNKNKGFAQGNNKGTEIAKGEYLFFLNPDTIVYDETIKNLVGYLKKNKKVGIVAPVLYNSKGKPYPLQGFGELTPFRAIFALSFLNKLFPNNKFSKRYWNQYSENKEVKEVDVIPGSAFIIKKDIFKKIRGFDEKFYLYFEENDICKKVKNLGYKIVMIQNSKVYHAWGKSTNKSKEDLKRIFKKSRFYYFKKHYGFFDALIVEFILRFSLSNGLILLIIALGYFLRVYKISEFMTFIGDQAWFYLSARDLLIFGKIPLVGIASSHPWLHQGPLWTYLLAGSLYLGNFNPVSGAYLTALMDCFTIFLMYKIGADFFTKRIGLVAALLYSVSPAMVFYSRMPYHTSPIPLLVALLVYSTLSWIVKRELVFIPIFVLCLSVLYNFELATLALVLVPFIYLILGYMVHEPYMKGIFSRRILILSFFSLIIPLIPFIFYDIRHSFPQTLGFGLWIIYKVFQAIGIIPRVSQDNNTYLSVILFFLNKYKLLIFFNWFAAGIALFLTFIYSIRQIVNRIFSPGGIVSSIFLTGVLGYLAVKTPSDAYLPMIFPLAILLFAIILSSVNTRVAYVVLAIITITNCSFILSNYLMNGKLSSRIDPSKKILKLSSGRPYNLIYHGAGEEFESTTMNYEYLTWWLGGNPPQKQITRQKILVEQKGNDLVVKKM